LWRGEWWVGLLALEAQGRGGGFKDYARCVVSVGRGGAQSGESTVGGSEAGGVKGGGGSE